MDKILSKIIEDTATKHLVDIQQVEQVLNLPYKMMREVVQGLDLHGRGYDEISDVKTNFNMPVLFKLYLNEFKINIINKKLKEDDATEE